MLTVWTYVIWTVNATWMWTYVYLGTVMLCNVNVNICPAMNCDVMQRECEHMSSYELWCYAMWMWTYVYVRTVKIVNICPVWTVMLYALRMWTYVMQRDCEHMHCECEHIQVWTVMLCNVIVNMCPVMNCDDAMHCYCVQMKCEQRIAISDALTHYHDHRF